MQDDIESERGPDAKTRFVKLEQLCLDPNNFRFLDQVKGVGTQTPDAVPDAKIATPAIQNRTRRLILGDKDTEQVRDLLDSFVKNGWLPVDQIQVRPLPKGKYLVVEGNRRVASLQELKRRKEEGRIDIGNLDPDFFDKVPVVMWSDTDKRHNLLLMGLKHISGNKRWKAINQAELLRTLIADGMTQDEICKSLGMVRRELSIYLQTLALCDTYKLSSYGDQFESEKFNLFREVIKSPALRGFIGWEETTQRPMHEQNLARLFSWMSKETAGDPENDELDSDAPGREPAISTPSNLRELAKIMGDAQALELLDSTRSLSQASRRSSVLAANQLQENLKTLNDVIQDVFRLSPHLRDEDEGTLAQAIRSLGAIQASRLSKTRVSLEAPKPTPFNGLIRAHFASVTLRRFKGLRDLTLGGIGRINLLAGLNNSGKTSVLEAIYLLTRQSDITALFENIRRRARLVGEPTPEWLTSKLPDTFEILGVFDQLPENTASVRLERFTDEAAQEQSPGYRGTLELHAEYAREQQSSHTRLYADRDRITHTKTNKVLCPVVFSSPFILAEQDLLRQAHQQAYDLKLNERLLELIRTHMDPNLIDIQLVSSSSQVDRMLPIQFQVQNEVRPTLDLHEYGEGLQRIYHLGLLACLARQGVLLIDEFENALHAQLIPHAARFLYDLAVEQNLQIFLTTHSRECIHAFLADDDVRSSTVGYTLHSGGSVNRIPGDLLRDLSEDIDFDLRRSIP